VQFTKIVELSDHLVDWKLYDPRLVIYASSVIYEYNGIIGIYNDGDRKKIINF
jgi:hypothetical protein